MLSVTQSFKLAEQACSMHEGDDKRTKLQAESLKDRDRERQTFGTSEGGRKWVGCSWQWVTTSCSRSFALFTYRHLGVT
jgi:hypothetical protein